MAKSAGYYNVDDFNDYKRKQGKCLPPRPNVLAAACHIQELFDAKKFTYGFMSGLPMLCLGYKREMPDLHIAYDDKNFERLKSKLESDRRVRLPTGMNPLLPFKILVWTGPEHKDQGCSINASIELDLVPSGACGTPVASDLARSLVLLGLRTASGRQMVFKTLNVHYLLATSLSHCKARDLCWDPRKDVLFLCKNETVEVQRIRTRLNVKEVKELFLGTPFFSRLHVQDQRLCYRTLLDTEPPPTMAITPPAPQPLAQPPPRQQVSERSNETRAPRSRYRNAIGQRTSSDGPTENGAEREARPQPMDYLQDPRRVSRIQGVQCVNSAKPQPVSAAAAAKQARKSMPNLIAPQNIAPDLDRECAPRQQDRQQQHHSLSHVDHLASQLVSGTLSRSSQLEYGGDFRPAHIRATNSSAVDDQINSLGQRTMTERTNLTKSDSTGTPVQGIQSQKGSLHIVSPEGDVAPHQQYFDENITLTRGRLHVVGPEGIYGTSENQQKSVQPQSQHQRHLSAPSLHAEPTSVFELDATAPAKPVFVAELPAEPIEPSSAERHNKRPEHMETPTIASPLNLHTSPAPSEAGSLPTSLVAGGLVTHSQYQTRIHSEHQEDSTFGFSTRHTNAYRYSSYAFPQSMSFKTAQVPSEEATGPVYKAYRPFVATHELNRNDSVSSVYSPEHKRNISLDSTASHESDKLAREYQELIEL